MKLEINVRITNDEGDYLENKMEFSSGRIESLKDLVIRTILAQLPGEAEALFQEAENPETVWKTDKPVPEKKPATKKPASKKPAAKAK